MFDPTIVLLLAIALAALAGIVAGGTFFVCQWFAMPLISERAFNLTAACIPRMVDTASSAWEEVWPDTYDSELDDEDSDSPPIDVGAPTVPPGLEL